MREQFHIVIIIGSILTACQTTKIIKFEPANSGTKNITASLVELGNNQAAGESLGSLPVELEIDKLSGKSLRLSAPGFDDQFWIAPANLSESNTVKVLLKQRADGNSEFTAVLSRASILLLKSYEALVEKDFDLAKRLADESQGAFNLGPGATIVKAIAYWQEGDVSTAQGMVKEAKVIYPDTQELEELLSAFKAP